MARGRGKRSTWRGPKRVKITPANRPRPARTRTRTQRKRDARKRKAAAAAAQTRTAPVFYGPERRPEGWRTPPEELATQGPALEDGSFTRRRQPTGLALYQAKKKAQKEQRLANLAKAREARWGGGDAKAAELVEAWTREKTDERLRAMYEEFHMTLFNANDLGIPVLPETVTEAQRARGWGAEPYDAQTHVGVATFTVRFDDFPRLFEETVPNGAQVLAKIAGSERREEYQRKCRSIQYDLVTMYARRLMRATQQANEVSSLAGTGVLHSVFMQLSSSNRREMITPTFLRTFRSDYNFGPGEHGGDLFGGGSEQQALRVSMDNLLGLWIPNVMFSVRQWASNNELAAELQGAGDVQTYRDQVNADHVTYVEGRGNVNEHLAERIERGGPFAAEVRRALEEWRADRQGNETLQQFLQRRVAEGRPVSSVLAGRRVYRPPRRGRGPTDQLARAIRENAQETLARIIQDNMLEFYTRESPELMAQLHRDARYYRRRRGGKAPWKNAATAIDLRRYQVDFVGAPQLSDDDTREHCLVYAMRMSGLFEPALVREVASRIYGINLTVTSLKQLCRDIDLHIHLTCYTEGSTNTVPINPNGRPPLELALYDDHFFLNEPAAVSHWVVANYAEAAEHGEHYGLGWRYKRAGNAYVYDPQVYKSSGTLIRAMHQAGLLRRLAGDDLQGMTRDYYSIKDFDESDLSYCPQLCKKIEFKERGDRPPYFWFADFETTTDGAQHLPYLFAALSQEDSRFVAKSYATTAENAQEIWSSKLNSFFYYAAEHSPPETTISVVFHNLNYDAAFVIPYVRSENPYDVVEINGKIIAFSFFHPGVRRSFYFRDSYALITAPLRAFGKMFQLEVEKEVFPYEFYSQLNFEEYGPTWPMVPLHAYLLHYKHPDELRAKLATVGVLDGEWVDAHKYSVYYCVRDCEVLRAGFLKFRQQLIEVTGLDCANYLTLPSIAYNYLIKEGVFEGCHNLTGQPLFFIRRCVLGGRCMLARNQKQDVTGEIADFDAVSLYPSAMARLYTLKGLPRLIEGHPLEELLEKDGFFAKIRVHRVPIALDFPLLAHTNKQGIKTYGNEPGEFYADDITVRSIMQFHGVDPRDIEVLAGYYYDKGKNFRIQEVIRGLFARRNELKRAGNPLEQVYKLLMNSCYGKSIMKPILERKLIATEERFQRILEQHATATLSYRCIGDKYAVNVAKDLVSAEAFPTFGVHILAMSKVIMSEVMVTAQRAGIPVYYTDTDSMHLPAAGLERLAACFRETYGRELVGKDMGQFHTDFPADPRSGLPTTSVRFIGVGKKAYIDQLVDAQGNVSHHMRMKGIPNDVIQALADEEYGGDPMALYEQLHAGNPVTFNLLHNRVSFLLNQDMTYTTRDEFTRTVNF